MGGFEASKDQGKGNISFQCVQWTSLRLGYLLPL